MAKKLNNEEKSSRYSQWIQLGEDFLDSYSVDWERWQTYWDTPHVATSVEESTLSHDGRGFKMPYNIIWLNWKNLTAVLTGGEYLPVVSPMEADKDRSAKLLESVMAHFLKVNNTKLEIKMLIQDVLTYNLAYMQQGYFSEFNQATGKKGPDEALRQAVRDGDIEKEKLDKKVLKSIDDYDDSAELMLEEIPDSETWYAKRLDPALVLVPPTAKYNLDEAPWLIKKIYKITYEAVQSFPSIKDLKPTYSKNFGTEEHPVEVDMFEIYEIWDKADPNDKKIVYVVAHEDTEDREHAGGTRVAYEKLVEVPWPTGLKGFPISRLSMNLSPRKYYLPPDVYMYEHIAQALSELLSTQLGSHRRHRRRYGYITGEIEPEELDKIAYGEDGIYFSANSQDSVWEFNQSMPQLDFGFYNMLQRIIGEFAGVDEFNRGSSSRVETATEASFVKGGSRTRVDDMISMIMMFMDEFFTKMGGIIQSHASGDVMVKVDPDTMKALGEESPWINVPPEEVEGRFFYTIKAGSVARETSEEKKRKFFEFYNMAAQDPHFDEITLRRLLIERWLEEPDPDDLLKVGMSGQIQQAIMLEHMMAMKGIPIPSPNPQEDHAMHAEAHEEALENPPEELKQRMAQMQNAGDQADPAQAQALEGEVGNYQQLIQAHLEETRQYLNPGGVPQNHNMNEAAMAEGAESPDTPRQPQTTVELGAGEIQQ